LAAEEKRAANIMPLLPKGKPLHKNLRSTFVKLSKMMKDLEEERFSGYLKLETPSTTGVILFEQGRISGAYTNPPSNDPVLACIEASSEDGFINVAELSPEVVYILSSSLKGEYIFRELPLEIVDVDRLWERLKRMEATCSVQVVEDNEPIFTILLFGGEVMEFIYEGEEELSREEGEIRLKELKNSPTATISVLKSAEERTAISFDPQEIIQNLSEMFGLFRREVIRRLGKDSFDRVFREAALELAEEYPFLDPFAPLVKMSPSGLEIEEDIALGELLEGCKALIAKMKRILAEKLGSDGVRDVENSVSSELRLIKSVREVLEER
jgi:hypothetical protein